VTSVANRGADHTGASQRTPSEDEQRIECEVEDHRSQNDDQRQPRPSDAPHQGLEHGIGEYEDHADEGNVHEAERAGAYIRRHPEQRQQAGSEQIAGGAQEDGGEQHHHHGLARNVVRPYPACRLRRTGP
jgi:hypothetical protein